MVRWKTAAGLIAALIGGWLAMIQIHRFVLAYFAIALWTLLVIVSWLTSQTVRTSRPTKKQSASNQKTLFWRKFRLKQFGVPVLVVLIGLIAGYLTFSEQRIYELSQFKGVLYPANDPDPPFACSSNVPDALKFFLGSATVLCEGKHGWIITAKRKKPPEDVVLLGIEKGQDGTLTLTAHIVGDDQKVIMNIDRNTFEINRNKILDSLSPPRPDLSTIVLNDEYGNKLKVRFLNKHSVSFVGKVYYRPGSYVEADDKGIRVMPQNLSFSKGFCFEMSHPDGATLFGVGDE